MDENRHDLSLVYRPTHLTYAELARCNALCFADEAFSQADYARMRQGDFWGAYLGETLVGYGILSAHEGACRIRRLAICPEQQGRGHGQRLLGVMLAHARSMECASLALSVQQDNPAAIHIYEKVGFRSVGESYQYLADVVAPTLAARRITAVPIILCAPESLPEAALGWIDRHRHPNNQVLLFRERGAGYVGFCRLDPGFPGCSPLEVWRDEIGLAELLAALADRLIPGKMRIKLTFSDPRLAQAAEREGYALNYKLHEMVLSPDARQPGA